MQKNVLCGSLIKQIHDEIDRRANASLQHRDVTLSQMSVLMELEGSPDHVLSMKELERLQHVSQSTMAGIVSRLEKKGFVEPLGDAEDRRVEKVRITDSGMRCCANAEAFIAAMETELLQGLTAGEKRELLDLLNRICDQF